MSLTGHNYRRRLEAQRAAEEARRKAEEAMRAGAGTTSAVEIVGAATLEPRELAEGEMLQAAELPAGAQVEQGEPVDAPSVVGFVASDGSNIISDPSEPAGEIQGENTDLDSFAAQPAAKTSTIAADGTDLETLTKRQIDVRAKDVLGVELDGRLSKQALIEAYLAAEAEKVAAEG